MSSSDQPPAQVTKVERLFPFALRARILIVGREMLQRRSRQIHFILVTHDLSEGSRNEILRGFSFLPIVQRYTSADLERLFRVRGTKVIGFRKSSLARSLFQELKGDQINVPTRIETIKADSKQPKLPPQGQGSSGESNVRTP